MASTTRIVPVLRCRIGNVEATAYAEPARLADEVSTITLNFPFHSCVDDPVVEFDRIGLDVETAKHLQSVLTWLLMELR
jgi:hypothetical protein